MRYFQFGSILKKNEPNHCPSVFKCDELAIALPEIYIFFLPTFLSLTPKSWQTNQFFPYALLMFTAWLQLDYRKILCNFCLLEFTRGPNGKCFNKEFALAFMRKCSKWLLLFNSTKSVDSQKYLDGSTNIFEDEKS